MKKSHYVLMCIVHTAYISNLNIWFPRGDQIIWIVKPIVKRIFIIVPMDSSSSFASFLFCLMCKNIVVDGRLGSVRSKIHFGHSEGAHKSTNFFKYVNVTTNYRIDLIWNFLVCT